MSSDASPLSKLSPLTSASPAAAPIGFLEPHALLEASAARRFVPPTWPVLLLSFGLIFGISAANGGEDTRWGQIVVAIGLVALWVGNNIMRRAVGRSIAAEIAAVTTLEELIQLRRWPEAADIAQRVLSRPMYLRERRLAALVSLATLLTRYHRFEEARVIHEYLLDGGGGGFVPDPATGHALRVARAMGMLREDHLVDADKAMSDLRREVNRARDEVRRHQGNEAAGEVQSAGLALLELYRDIKTRHYEEASASFDRSLPVLRDQLGMRMADAWMLVAAARDGLGRTEDARIAYENATTLAPALELHRRYPETTVLSERYTAATIPGKAGQS